MKRTIQSSEEFLKRLRNTNVQRIFPPLTNSEILLLFEKSNKEKRSSNGKSIRIIKAGL